MNNKIIFAAAVVIVGIGVFLISSSDMLLAYAQNDSEILSDIITSNLTELGLENFPTIEDMNEINSIKKLGAQATNEIKTFTGLIDNVAETCAYKMNEDAFDTILAQMCADLMTDYANILRNFTQSNQNVINAILYE